ncbi:MAG: nucleoside deaminase [Puniceicoccales bacterium]|jgi:tRNA(Arg) A34 adenosine deaminase TadA|nr:nucleoside deaminase [Puniceicoccales bacterium]
MVSHHFSKFMKLAIQEAEKAAERGSVPVGAVIILEDNVIASAGNEVLKSSDPTAHAEIVAIRRACAQLGCNILENCDIYITLEPCAMCAQAIALARISRLYFGAYDKKYGGVVHGCHVFDHSIHKPEVIGGISEALCAKILQNFFKSRRN